MRVLVGMPTTGSVPIQVVASIVKMVKSNPNIDIVFDENSLVYDSRNNILEEAIVSGYDYLLFIDSDIIFPADAVLQLLVDKKDIVTGVYYERKGDKHRPVLFKNVQIRDGNNPPTAEFVEDVEPFMSVDACGMGFCLIKLDAIQPVIKEYLSPFEPYQGIGEDLSFCYKCKQMGIDIWADSRFDLKHLGIQAFGKEDYKK